MTEAGLFDRFLEFPRGFRGAVIMITKKLITKFCSITINQYNDERCTTL
jgi:hypothetical protein